MNFNPSPLAIFQITANSSQTTPVADLQKELEDFKVEWQKKASSLPIPTDRETFALEIHQLWQTLCITLSTLSACGTPYSEIAQKMRFSLDNAKAQLSLSLTSFKVQSAAFIAASSQFEQRVASSSTQNFAAFSAPKVTAKLPYARKPNVEMEAKKRELARCVQMSMDPESPSGAMLCLAHHSKGLAEAEKNELSEVVPKAIIGKGINDLAMPSATVSMAINKTIQAALHALVYNACLELDPFRHQALYANSVEILEGRNPRVNRAIKEALPDWALSAAKYVMHANLQLAIFDMSLQQEYFTCPGIVHEACLGIIDLATYKATNLLWKGASRILRASGQAIDRTSELAEEMAFSMFLRKRFYAFAINEMGGGPTPKFISKTSLSQKNFRLAAKINQLFRREPNKPASFILENAIDTLQQLIPTYNVGETQNVWARALREHISSIQEVYYFKQHPNRSIARVKGDRGSFVIRDTMYWEEALNELTGLEFLRSLELRNLSVPSPLFLGQYKSQFFLVKNFIEGKTLFELMEKKALPTLLEASERAGRALGEVQSKYLHPSPVSQGQVEIAIGNLCDKLQDLDLQITKNIKKLIKDFSQAPGQAAYGFGDIHSKQFVFSPKGLFLIDADFVSTTFTGSKLPSKIASLEYQEFLTMFELDGLKAGLTFEEIRPLQQAFMLGFSSEYKGTKSIAAKRFFEAYSHLDIAHYFMDEPARKELVRYHIDQFFQKIGERPSNSTSEIVKMATESPGEINVVGVMKSNLVPSYGTQEPVSAFVKKTINTKGFKLVKEENPFSGNHLYTVLNTHGEPIAFVKDYIATRSAQQGFVPEIVSYAFLRSQELKHSVLPEIMAVGKYASNGAERGLVMYEFVPGDSVSALLSTPGNVIPAKEIGKALGELNTITAGSPVSEIYLENKIRLLNYRAMAALEELRSIGISTPFSMKDVVLITRDVRRNPGIGTVTHGDAHPGNFIFRSPKLTMIDPGSLIQSVTPKGIPHGMPAFDYYQMLVNIRNYGIRQGFSEAKIERLAAEFIAGYQELFYLQQTREVERFAELYWQTYTLNTLLAGHMPSKELAQRTLKILESKFCHSAKVAE